MSTPNILIPPPPYQTPFNGQNGIVSPAWSKWLQQLYLRAGGASAPSTAGLASAITTLQSNVASNTTSITALGTLTTTLSNEFDGLSVGRHL